MAGVVEAETGVIWPAGLMVARGPWAIVCIHSHQEDEQPDRRKSQPSSRVAFPDKWRNGHPEQASQNYQTRSQCLKNDTES